MSALSAHIVTSPAAAAIRRCRSIPAVQYVYGKEINARPRLAKYAIDNAAASIAISRYTRDLALATGARERRVTLIPPGVDLPLTTDSAANERNSPVHHDRTPRGPLQGT